MATLLPLPCALSLRRPVSLAAYSVESRLHVCLSLESFLCRFFLLRTVPTMAAFTAFLLSRTPARHRAARLSSLLVPSLLLSPPLVAVPLSRCAALFCLPSPPLHPFTGPPLCSPPNPSSSPWRPDTVLPDPISSR